MLKKSKCKVEATVLIGAGVGGDDDGTAFNGIGSMSSSSNASIDVGN